jgi:hypothetical protein
MARQALILKISRKVRLDPDFERKRATISCETKDGRSIHLVLDFPTLEKLHKQFDEYLERIWTQ